MNDLDAVLFDLMLEEPAPTHEALCRWIVRFPGHRIALEEFFVAWALSDAYQRCRWVPPDE